MYRIKQENINQMIEASKETITQENNSINNQANTVIEPIKETITFDDFSKIDLRIAEIINAEHIEGADKLLKITISLGDKETKQIFAGIKSAYNPENLIGKFTVVVANLAPRKMRFGISEGMILAAGPGGKDIWLIHPDNGAKPGDRVK